MKINELIESSESDKNIDLWKISNNVEKIMNEYRNGRLSTEVALNTLEEYDSQIKNLIYDNDEYWANLYKKFSNKQDINQIANDWIQLENTIEYYCTEIKNGSIPPSLSSSLHENAKRISHD